MKDIGDTPVSILYIWPSLNTYTIITASLAPLSNSINWPVLGICYAWHEIFQFHEVIKKNVLPVFALLLFLIPMFNTLSFIHIRSYWPAYFKWSKLNVSFFTYFIELQQWFRSRSFSRPTGGAFITLAVSL